MCVCARRERKLLRETEIEKDRVRDRQTGRGDRCSKVSRERLLILPKFYHKEAVWEADAPFQVSVCHQRGDSFSDSLHF